jgi:hypothetical protein
MGIVILDIDTLRFVLVASVVAGFAVYSLLRISSGGVFTSGYLVILGLLGEWVLILAVVLVSAISYVVVKRITLRFFALPKVWTFFGFVLASATLMSVFTLASTRFGPFVFPGGLEIVLVVGAYITPGLLAYDIAHQGFTPTMIGVGLVGLGTILLTVPVIAWADFLVPISTTPYVLGFGEIPAGLYWLVVLAAIVFSGALRLSFGVRSGGFIGAVFIVQMFSLAAVVTIVSASIAAYLIATLISRYIIFSPRQQFHLALMIGMMVAWTSLYWASLLGWVPALAANAFALQPLLAVGLIAADMRRPESSVTHTLIGVGSSVVFLVLVIFAATGSGIIAGAATVMLVLGVPLILLIPGLKSMTRNWRLAREAGSQEAQALLGTDQWNR